MNALKDQVQFALILHRFGVNTDHKLWLEGLRGPPVHDQKSHLGDLLRCRESLHKLHNN